MLGAVVSSHSTLRPRECSAATGPSIAEVPGPSVEPVLRRVRSLLLAVDADLDASELAPERSLTRDLGFDSVRLGALLDRIRQAFDDVDLTPWLIEAAQRGDDTIAGLAAALAGSPARADYVALARELAAGFAPRAREYDESGRFPHENFAELVASGYTAMTVPRRHGGGGASLEEVCRAQEALATGCASTAFAVNMHIHGVALLSAAAGSTIEWAYEAIVREGALLAGGFSEPDVGGHWLRSTTRATPVPGGYRLRGTKGFFSGYPASGLVFLSAAIPDERGVESPVGFLLPRPAAGIRVAAEWSAGGMRATGSHTLEIDDLHVASRYRIGAPGELPLLFMRACHWAWCSFAAVFVGIAGAALEHVAHSQRRRTLQVVSGPLARLPGVQFRVAEMHVKLAAARACLYRAVRSVQDEPAADPLAHYIDMSLMKTTVCRLAHEIVTLAVEVEGGSGYASVSPIQRMYRDVAAGLLVPPVTDVTLEWAGKQALGIPVLGEPRWAV
ncbi:acyl-CoA dehydrogenase family protein [Nannocystis pusilla]|uniref:Acyl-CoA dehydrogenase family protein n=1 Tax=Nannocystis pusilla TaxID=889268 RepID=A0ABS7U5M6_9BACT|nr:acyl-CoA dehydrogenase family protein [Nannocystis pusilla]MBZ5715691.1 acyl-CoA dehydrogenase family protein [Nannocystis pusilla]